jgi:hypothetical protein
VNVVMRGIGDLPFSPFYSSRPSILPPPSPVHPYLRNSPIFAAHLTATSGFSFKNLRIAALRILHTPGNGFEALNLRCRHQLPTVDADTPKMRATCARL